MLFLSIFCYYVIKTIMRWKSLSISMMFENLHLLQGPKMRPISSEILDWRNTCSDTHNHKCRQRSSELFIWQNILHYFCSVPWPHLRKSRKLKNSSFYLATVCSDFFQPNDKSIFHVRLQTICPWEFFRQYNITPFPKLFFMTAFLRNGQIDWLGIR